MIFLPSLEPMFAQSMRRKGNFIVYIDADGFPSCCNFTQFPNFRKCEICGNNCIQFIVDDKGKYICSACGKFPREVLLT